MSDQYFTVGFTSVEMESKREPGVRKVLPALTIFSADPVVTPDGAIKACAPWPFLVITPGLWSDEQERAERVAKLLNENAHLFFESARTDQPG